MRERTRHVDVESVEREFEGIDLGDKRLESRARRIAGGIAPAPSSSFPEQMTGSAEREALYRFFANPKVTMDRLLSAHARATRDRLRQRAVIRVVHDTTAFRFAGDRDGLGIIRGDVKGFFAHVSLAMTADESREPLGVLALDAFIRDEAVAHRGMTMQERKRVSRAKARAERESSRWERQAIEVETALPDTVHAIHVMDREADDYVMFAELQRAGIAFVVRVAPQRRTKPDRVAANELLAASPSVIFRTVRLAMRPKHKQYRMNKPVRAERDAELLVRWGHVRIERTNGVEHASREIAINAVHVFEPSPPRGEEPIEWMLFTSEPVDNLEDATAIVDHYRARWIVEEYFKALKTGCGFEKRQLTSFDGLTKALALFVPIAWHLLLLRHLGRSAPSRDAAAVFDGEQLLLLRALLEQRRHALPANPDVGDVMLGIAALGGHIRNNGDPGWLVLGRGFTRFVEAEAVWRLARTYDQS